MSLDFLFINPCADVDAERQRKEKMKIEKSIERGQPPHFGMGYLLASAKKEDVKAKYVDMGTYEITTDELFKIIQNTQPTVIGFTAFTIQIKSAAFIAQQIKEKFPNSIICVGGPHATAIPFQTLDEFPVFDFVICCEGENLLVPILENLSDLEKVPGIAVRSSKTYQVNRINNLDSLPFPAWEEFDLSRYPGENPHRTSRELPIATSRGCPFTCNFCMRMSGKKRRTRSVDSVIAEMERNIIDFDAKAFFFTDETFILKLSESELLFEAMINRGINKKAKWSCSTRVDIVTPDTFKLMRKAGCYYVFFGFEHSDNEMLKIMGKQIVSDQAINATKWAKEAGIVVVGCFILGLPGETLESARRNIHFAKNLDIYSTSFPIACPYPGTLLREQAERHDYGLKILTDDWDQYGKQYPGVMESETISIDELRGLQKEAYELNPKKNLDDYEKVNTYL